MLCCISSYMTSIYVLGSQGVNFYHVSSMSYYIYKTYLETEFYLSFKCVKGKGFTQSDCHFSLCCVFFSVPYCYQQHSPASSSLIFCCSCELNQYIFSFHMIVYFIIDFFLLTQRRLSGMERDLAAIQAKLDSLEAEADAIGAEHPEEAEVIRERITQIQGIWEQLTHMVINFRFFCCNYFYLLMFYICV